MRFREETFHQVSSGFLHSTRAALYVLVLPVMLLEGHRVHKDIFSPAPSNMSISISYANRGEKFAQLIKFWPTIHETLGWTPSTSIPMCGSTHCHATTPELEKAGEMPQQPKHALLCQRKSLVPSNHLGRVTTTCNSSPKGSDIFSGLYGHPHSCDR